MDAVPPGADILIQSIVASAATGLFVSPSDIINYRYPILLEKSHVLPNFRSLSLVCKKFRRYLQVRALHHNIAVLTANPQFIRRRWINMRDYRTMCITKCVAIKSVEMVLNMMYIGYYYTDVSLANYANYTRISYGEWTFDLIRPNNWICNVSETEKHLLTENSDEATIESIYCHEDAIIRVIYVMKQDRRILNVTSYINGESVHSFTATAKKIGTNTEHTVIHCIHGQIVRIQLIKNKTTLYQIFQYRSGEIRMILDSRKLVAYWGTGAKEFEIDRSSLTLTRYKNDKVFSREHLGPADTIYSKVLGITIPISSVQIKEI